MMVEPNFLPASVREKYLKANPLPRGKLRSQIIIGFVGMPGSGKTTVTGVLLEALPLFRISGDDLRDIFRDAGIDQGEEQERLVGLAREHLLEEALARGLSVVWDGDLLRKIPEIKRRAAAHGIPLLVVKLECSEKTLLKRLEAKGEAYLRAFPRWQQEHKQSKLSSEEFFFMVRTERDLGSQIKELLGEIDRLQRKSV